MRRTQDDSGKTFSANTLPRHAVQHQPGLPKFRVGIEGSHEIGRRLGALMVVQIQQARGVEFRGSVLFSQFHHRQRVQGLFRCLTLPQPPLGQTAVQTGQRGDFLALRGGLCPCTARGLNLVLRPEGLAQPEP